VVGPCTSSCALCLENFFSCHLDCACILPCHHWMAALFCFVLSPFEQIVHFIYIHQICKIKMFSINNQQGLGVISRGTQAINPLKPVLNPICYLLALLGAHHFLHVSRIRVKLLTFRLLMSYVYGAPILDVSRSHTTTQHSR